MYHNHYNAYNWNTGANYSQSWGGAPSGDLKDEAKAIFGDKKYLQQLKDAKTDAAKGRGQQQQPKNSSTLSAQRAAAANLKMAVSLGLGEGEDG